MKYADGSLVTYDVTMYGCAVGGQMTASPDGVEALESRWFAKEELDESVLAVDMAEIVPAAFEWFRVRQDAGWGGRLFTYADQLHILLL